MANSNILKFEARTARQRPPVPCGGAAASLLRVSFEQGGSRLLHELTLDIPAQGLTVVMGPNGAGKSLLLRMIAGLIPPTSGSILLGGNVASAIGLVFQRPVLLRRSVVANLDHALKAFGVSRAERMRRNDDLLKLAGLWHLGERPARRLSGGEQQRLALVRTLAGNPRLLLLDEPTASLDPQSTHLIETLVRATSAAGTKIVLVTHDQGQARRLADDVVFLHQGRLIEQSPADVFLTLPRTGEAEAFLAGELLV